MQHHGCLSHLIDLPLTLVGGGLLQFLRIDGIVSFVKKNANENEAHYVLECPLCIFIKKIGMFPISKCGWAKPTRTMVPWRQGFRHPTRNECMGWFAQILKM